MAEKILPVKKASEVMRLPSLRNFSLNGPEKKRIEILLAILWGTVAFALIFVIGLSFAGGPPTSFTINPQTMQPGAPHSENPGFATSARLPRVSWKTILLGGLVYSAQMSVSENQKPLPNRACDKDVALTD